MTTIHSTERTRFAIQLPRTRGALGTVGAIALLGSLGLADNLVVNGSFEDEGTCSPVFSYISLAAEETCMPGWTVSTTPSGGVNYVGTVWVASDGDNSIELTDSDDGGIEQPLTTVVGQSYCVEFDLAGQPGSSNTFRSMRVEVDSVPPQFRDFGFNTSGQSVNDMGWERRRWSFTATDTTTILTLRSIGNAGNYGATIDDVCVVETTSLLLNGSFEDSGSCPPGTWTPLAAGETCIPGWVVSNVVGGGVNYIGTLWTASEGVNSIELDGGPSGAIEQNFATEEGRTYRVLFDLAGQPGGGSSVRNMRAEILEDPLQFVDLSFDTSGFSTSNMGWVQKEWLFIAAAGTSTTLRLGSTDSGSFHAAIDNVAVMECEELIRPFCYCDAISPCSNLFPTGGCINATGDGAVLIASGTTSVLADDLVLRATSVKPNSFGLFYRGLNAITPIPFGNGTRCVSGGIVRFNVQSTGSTGAFEKGPGIVAGTLSGTAPITAYSTWHFQGWFRDVGGPCNQNFNFTNGVSVTFTP